MKLSDIEPFAIGFKEADVSGIEPEYEREYRIACGNKKLYETLAISIEPSAYFVGPRCRFPGIGVNYNRGGGIELFDKYIEENKAAYPELADELEALYSEFAEIETGAIAGKMDSEIERDLADNRCCWGAGSGHANPDYEMLLRIGTSGIRKKIELFRKIHTDKMGFYDALEVSLSTLEIIAERYKKLAEEIIKTASGEDAVILGRIISAFENIPQNTPRNFFEACQFFWLAYSFIINDSPGLFDFALGRYYENDDPEDRYECLKKLWELFRDVRAWNLCVGGSDEFGNDLSCALTYDVLRVARETGYNTPNITDRKSVV